MKDSFISTSTEIHPCAQKVNNISPEMLSQCASSKDVLKQFVKFVGKDYVVAHNAAFDMRMLRQDIQRVNQESDDRINDPTDKFFCTMVSEITCTAYPRPFSKKCFQIGHQI